MPITSLNEAFAYELACIYDAEQRFAEAQQEVVLRVSDERLRALVEEHITATQQQIRNLEQVFELLGTSPERIMSATSGALLTDSWKSLQEAAGHPSVADFMMALTLARVEYFEVASYRGLVLIGEAMGKSEVLRLVHENLHQEEQTAQALEAGARSLGEQALQAQNSSD